MSYIGNQPTDKLLTVNDISPDAIQAGITSNVPAGNIAATTVQAAINELDTEKQPLNTTLTAIAAGTLGQFSFRNKIINGEMAIAQRSTGLTGITTAGYKTVDRWYADTDGAINYDQIQAFFDPGTEPAAGIYAYLYHQINSSSGQNYSAIGHNIESVRTLNGKTVTLSFWAKADIARTITFEVQQRFGSGGSNTVWGIGTQSFSLTTSWQRFTKTFTVPSITGKTIGVNNSLTLLFFIPPNTALVFNLTGVQLEEGSVATPFEHRPIGTELALCQRYYEAQSFMLNSYILSSTNNVQFRVPWVVNKRVAPTLTVTGASGSSFTNNSVVTDNLTSSYRVVCDTNGSGSGNGYYSGTVAGNAEL
jgi:hypothetical protein